MSRDGVELKLCVFEAAASIIGTRFHLSPPYFTKLQHRLPPNLLSLLESINQSQLKSKGSISEILQTLGNPSVKIKNY